MSTVVSTPIVDKNGKQTTVKKKVGEAPKPASRPIPKPFARPQVTVTPEQRNKDAVRDLLARLTLPYSESVWSADVKEIQRNVYAVHIAGQRIVAFDAVQVSDEVVSGVITSEDGKIGGKLYRGDGTSGETDSKGYALHSAEAAIETQLDAAKIAASHL